jgi:hypothetical protein
MKLPNPVSIPQMVIRGPGGTPKRFSIELNSAALAAFSERPLAAMAEAPRLAMKSERESLKLCCPRSALMVPTE